jgi:hypothetical protein
VAGSVGMAELAEHGTPVELLAADDRAALSALRCATKSTGRSTDHEQDVSGSGGTVELLARTLAPGGAFRGAQSVGFGTGFEDVCVDRDAVDDGRNQPGIGKHRYPLNGRLLPSAILARSSHSVMICNSNSAPRGSIWT